MKSLKPDSNKVTKKIERRDFLRKTWKILGIVAAAEFTFFSLNLLRPAKDKGKNTTGNALKIIGNVEDFSKNSVTTDRANKLYLIRMEDGAFLALSLMCSHLGCSVGWDQQKNQFICPCHSSAFDERGIVINSPAPRPLDYFPVIIEEGKVKVDTGQRTKRRKFEKNQLTYAI